MAFKETSHNSYGSRIGGSLKGIVSGFILLIASTVLLFWNEGNFIKTKKDLQEGKQAVVELKNVDKIDPQMNGKFIHASALADTKDSLSDENFGVKELAISLNRKVEYYQWVEKSETKTKDNLGGSQDKETTYTYKLEWSDNPVNSSEFKDPAYQGKNFIIADIQPQKTFANDVTFGAYQLPSFIVQAISNNQPVAMNLSDEQKQKWEASLRSNLGIPTQVTEVSNTPVSAVTDTLSASKVALADTSSSKLKEVSSQGFFHVINNGNTAYLGKAPSQPQVGDIRVVIEKTIPSTISILAKVNENTFETYMGSNGKDISKVVQGNVSADQMFAQAFSSNSRWMWILRVVGIILAIAGLKTMFSILETLFKVVPFLSNIVGAGVGIVVTIVGFAWSLVIIAIAWLFYRPLIALLLLAVVVGLIVYLKKKGTAKTITKADS